MLARQSNDEYEVWYKGYRKKAHLESYDAAIEWICDNLPDDSDNIQILHD